MTTKKKKKTTKKPKIYQKQSQGQKVSIKIDNSKKTSGRARKATTSSPSVIYLGSNQAPQPFPYYFPVEKNSFLPEVASNVGQTLLGQKLGEAPKTNVFETLGQSTQIPQPKKRERKTPSEATTEKISEKPEKDPKQKTMTDFYKLNLKRKPETSQSTSSSAPPAPKKTRAPRVSKVGKDQPKITQVLPPLAKEVPMQIGEPVGKDSEHYWG